MNARYRRSSSAERESAAPDAAQRTSTREASPSGSRRASLRLALKIAARTSARASGRSALIAVMVALPVAGLTTVAVVYDSSQPTVEERISTELGNAEAMLRMPTPGAPLLQVPTQPDQVQGVGPQDIDPTLEISSLLPSGSQILSHRAFTVTAETKTGIASFNALEGSTWHESFAGRFSIADGRTPRSDREVMVTAATLPRLGIQLGESVAVSEPGTTTVTVVGVIDAQIWPDSTEHFFTREGLFGKISEADKDLGVTYYLPDTALDWSAVEELNRHGVTVLSRAVLRNPPPLGTGYEGYNSGAFGAILTLTAILAAFAAFEVVLLAGAAFTVTARQQQRSLATMASVGATPGMLFRVITASGLVLGAIGGIVGIIAGIGGAAAFMAATGNGSSTQYYGLHLPWPWLLAVTAFAVLIGWVASLLPARNAVRFDVVAALRGSRRPPTPSKRTPVEGVIMLGIGVTLTLTGGILLAVLNEAGRSMSGGHPLVWLPTLMLMVGPILAQMGLIKCGPLMLSLAARAMSAASLGARLGARDAARNPGRSVPAVAAIMTTVFVAVVGMNLAGSFQQRQLDNFQYQRMPGQVEVALSTIDWGGVQPERVSYASAQPVVAAIQSALEINELRVLSSVEEPIYGLPNEFDGDNEPVKYPTPRVPRAGLCPLDEASPDNEDIDPQRMSLAIYSEDPRCGSSFASMNGVKDHLWVGGVEDLSLVLGRKPSKEAQQVLASGGAVSIPDEYVYDGKLDIAWMTPAQIQGGQDKFSSEIRTDTLPAVVEDPGLQGIYFGVFISPETADSLGIVYQESTVLAALVRSPNAQQLDAVNGALIDLQPTRNTGLDLMRNDEPNFAELWAWGLLILGALIAVASSAVAIGLARFDGRQDDATLTALGAGQVLRRSFAFWQALLIAGLGTLLGVGMGMIPALGLGAGPDIPFAPPWVQIGLAVVALPLLIACGSWLVAGKNNMSARRMAVS